MVFELPVSAIMVLGQIWIHSLVRQSPSFSSDDDRIVWILLLGYEEGVQDNISARLNKSALVSYRLTGLIALAELAFELVEYYQSEYVTFGSGEADETFCRRIKRIVSGKYDDIVNGEKRFLIKTEVCKRGRDVTVQNLAQYMALMKISNEDKKNWSSPSGRLGKINVRSVTDNQDTESKLAKRMKASPSEDAGSDYALTRKQKNMLQKINTYKAVILLHKSLVFNKSGLYTNSFLKKASSILEERFLRPLVVDGFLLAIPNGLICRKSKVVVYIKAIPSSDDESKQVFAESLARFGYENLDYNTYMDSCSSINFKSTGVLNDEVFEILRTARYQCLNIDLSPLISSHAHSTVSGNEGLTLFQIEDGQRDSFLITDISSVPSTTEIESIDSVTAIENIMGDDFLEDALGHENDVDLQLDDINILDSSSERMCIMFSMTRVMYMHFCLVDDRSVSNAAQLIVVNEEIVENIPPVADNQQQVAEPVS